MAERGPLPKLNARRRNKRPSTNRRILIARPTLPKEIVGEARAEWRRVVPELEAMGMLAKVDRGVLIRYVTIWADWCELNTGLQATAKLVKGSHGELIRNPLWRMRNEAEQNLIEIGRQLGLTPVARIRSGVVHEPPVAEDAKPGPTALDDYRRLLAR